MMKTKWIVQKWVLGVFCLLAFAFSADAQTTKAKVHKTQVVQHSKIHHGVHNGELTKREAKALKIQQRNIRKHKRHAAQDGVVTRKERASIRRHQAVADKNIKMKKHNPRKRH